jgi:acetylornithine deacetylase/succinyl-diaminopimelate desuccinylase-like protein
VSDAGIQDRPVELLQRLLRFDTTNPPGGERECIDYVRGLLEELDVEVRVEANDPDRPNLIARLPGRGDAAPLLMQGHVDVVPAEGDWTHPPFAGEVAEGYVWGRGALDMKGGVAMMLAALMRAKARGLEPPGDVILCVLADEEAGGNEGAQFLVAEHPELFEGVQYAIGEFGGFTLDAAGRRFAPIMVGEKQPLWLRVVIKGPAGHASIPIRGGAMGQLGQLLQRLDRRRLPVHVTPVPRRMIETMAEALPPHLALLMRGLLNPRLTDRLLDLMGEDNAKRFGPVLHNTVSVTRVDGGSSKNVIPGEVTAELDCRLLPGFGAEEAIAEVRRTAGIDDLEIEVVRHDPSAKEPDLALYDTLAGILRELDGEIVPVPMLLPAVTDGRHFAKLGIQTYGFLPMQLPEELPFMELVHSQDERLPVDAMEYGTEAIGRLLERFG